jgi:hypothetical protein
VDGSQRVVPAAEARASTAPTLIATIHDAFAAAAMSFFFFELLQNLVIS